MMIAIPIGVLALGLVAVDPQAAALPPAQAATAPPASLADLVAELERNNPELQAAKRELDMRVARVAPAGALPDPTLSASSMTGFTRPPFFPSTSTPDAFRLFSISQEIPYPGKRALRASVAVADAEAERFNVEDRRRMLVADLKTTYLGYVAAIRSLEVLADSKALADELRQIAEARFSVGKGAQQDVVKAQVELSMLLERRAVLEQQRDAYAARIKALLFRPQPTPAPGVVTYTAAPVPRDLTALQEKVEEHYAGLQHHAKAIEKQQRELALAQKNLRPDFRVGLSAQRYTGEMPWMYGLDLMVSLPVWAASKQRPLIQEAAAALEATTLMHHNANEMANAEVTQAFLAARSADELMTLYTDSVLPQSRLALESSLAAYQVGGVDFLSVLTSFQALVAAQFARVEQQMKRDQALARLEPFVGDEFVK